MLGNIRSHTRTLLEWRNSEWREASYRQLNYSCFWSSSNIVPSIFALTVNKTIVIAQWEKNEVEITQWSVLIIRVIIVMNLCFSYRWMKNKHRHKERAVPLLGIRIIVLCVSLPPMEIIGTMHLSSWCRQHNGAENRALHIANIQRKEAKQQHRFIKSKMRKEIVMVNLQGWWPRWLMVTGR